MSKKIQRDGSREHELAERHAEMARAALQQSFEDYLARHLADAGAATLEQLPPDVGLIAMIAWSEVFTRVSRDFEALMKRWTRDGLKDEPADASDSLGRVEELAALYRLGEMAQQ